MMVRIGKRMTRFYKGHNYFPLGYRVMGQNNDHSSQVDVSRN